MAGHVALNSLPCLPPLLEERGRVRTGFRHCPSHPAFKKLRHHSTTPSTPNPSLSSQTSITPLLQHSNTHAPTVLDQGPILTDLRLLLVSLRNLSSRCTILACCGQKVPTTKQPLIVVVDDDESVCRALKRLIGSLGMSAETFGSSSEFVDLIEALPSFQPDCVVLDVQMPDMNGIEVQACLSRARGEIPIIFVTAHDDRAVRAQALAAGAVAFLRKPFNDSLLIRTIEAALGRGENGRKQNGSEWGNPV